MGEDVTANVRTIADIPATPARRRAPRSSRRAARSTWRRRRSWRSTRGCSPRPGIPKRRAQFANPRNAAARIGCARRTRASRHRGPLRFLAWGWGEVSAPLAESQFAAIARIAGWGFPRLGPAGPRGDARRSARPIPEDRGRAATADLPFDIDGVVYKVDRLDWQGPAGLRRPRSTLGAWRTNSPPSARRQPWSGSTSRSAAPASSPPSRGSSR
ncbi:MAG: hypothetical protein WDN24_07190 [Sphingomonas sp.]